MDDPDGDNTCFQPTLQYSRSDNLAPSRTSSGTGRQCNQNNVSQISDMSATDCGSWYVALVSDAKDS